MNISTKNLVALLKIKLTILGAFIILSSNAQKYTVYRGENFVSDNIKLYQGDIINRKDSNDLKQGLWVYTDRNTRKIKSLGYYKNGKREGLWIKLRPNGSILSEIHYKDGKKNGYARTFYPDGTIQEEGIWKVDTWVGEYRYYYPNGQLCYLWYYDETGKRSGEQQYFHKNGKLKIVGNWDKGLRNGVMKEFYEDGSLCSEITFKGDEADSTKITIYKPGEKRSPADIAVVTPNKVILTPKDTTKKESLATGIFNPNGYNKLFNLKNKKIEKEGQFRNGKLYTGKWYIYNDKGVLIRELELKEGKRIKDIKYPQE